MAENFSPSDAGQVLELLAWAAAETRALEVRGLGSKAAWGRPRGGWPRRDLAALSGVSLYEPEELVLSAGAGTPLAEIEELLAAENQQLAFEPPSYAALLGGSAEAGATIGGVLVANLGWSSIFLALGVYALIMAVVVAIGIPEPMRPEYRQPLRLCSLLRNYRQIGTDISFLGYALTNALIYAGLFAFLSGSSFVLIDFLGVAPEHFGLFFACIVVGYITGNLSALRLSSALTPDQILVRGLIIAVVSGALMAGLAVTGVYNVWAMILPQALFMVGTGMVLPQTMAGAMANFPHMAGSASALYGFGQMAVAAAAGVLVGQLHDGTSMVMAVIIASCACAALASYLLLVQRHPAPGFEPQGASAQ